MELDILSIDEYKVLAFIGVGGQANVYLCEKSMKLYAAKLFNFGAFKAQSFTKQSQFLKLLSHENIVHMIQSNSQAIVRYTNGIEVKKSMIVLEYAWHGQLYEYISVGKAFKAEVCRTIFEHMLNGMQYLNRMGIAHRDIKPENILLDEEFMPKFSDFGLSTYSEGADKDYKLKTKVGTEGFKAPQIDQGSYVGQTADIFSLGVLLFMLYSGAPPFISTKASNHVYKHLVYKNYEKFWQAQEKGKPKGFFSASFKKLMNQMLSNNPQERPSLDALKDCQWMNEHKASLEEMKQELKARHMKIIEESEQKKGLYEISKKYNKIKNEPQNNVTVNQNLIKGIETLSNSI